MPTSILKEQYIRNSEVISMHTDLKSCQSTQMNLLGDFYVFFFIIEQTFFFSTTFNIDFSSISICEFSSFLFACIML